MEARIARLEAEIYRLRSDIEVLRLRDRNRAHPVGRACVAASLVVTAILYGALAAGFGWI